MRRALLSTCSHSCEHALTILVAVVIVCVIAGFWLCCCFYGRIRGGVTGVHNFNKQRATGAGPAGNWFTAGFVTGWVAGGRPPNSYNGGGGNNTYGGGGGDAGGGGGGCGDGGGGCGNGGGGCGGGCGGGGCGGGGCGG